MTDKIINECEKEWLEKAICGGFSAIRMSPSFDFQKSYFIIIDGIVEFETSSEYFFPMKFGISEQHKKIVLKNPSQRQRILENLDVKCLKVIHNLKKEIIQRHPDIKSMKFSVPRR